MRRDDRPDTRRDTHIAPAPVLTEADFLGRVALVQAFPVTSQFELAAQLRKFGYQVVSIVPEACTRKERVQMLLDRLIFDEVWPLLHGRDIDAIVDESTVFRILSDPTVDVHAFDSLGAQLAPRRADVGVNLRAGLAPMEWYDKRWMADRLEELGIPGPSVWDEPRAHVFPVIVKSRITSGGLGVRICADQRQVEHAWRELGGDVGKAFLQEFLGGSVLSTAGVAQEGHVLAHETYKAIKAPGDPTGPSLHQEIVNRPDLVATTRKLIADVGFTGIFSLQQIDDADGRGRPFDFNPRCPGTFGALSVAGSALFPTYLAVLAGNGQPTGRTLAPGTTTHVVRLSYVKPWPDSASFSEWYRYTGRQIRARRDTHGTRFVVWGYAMRSRLLLQGLRKSARSGA